MTIVRAGDARLQRRRPDGDLPARVQARHPPGHRGGDTPRARAPAAGGCRRHGRMLFYYIDILEYHFRVGFVYHLFTI